MSAQSQNIKRKQSGFTLVELAIAIAVIGLLLGGILKGVELVENAKITSMIKQVTGYNMAAANFTGMYGTLPGDLKNPADHLPNCDEAPCTVSGNDDGVVISRSNCTMYGGGLSCEGRMEQVNFFHHMYAAGVMKGSLRLYGSYSAGGETMEQYVPDDFPFKSVNVIVLYHTTAPHTLDPYDFTNAPAPRVGHFYHIAALPTHAIEKIDYKLDDGKPFEGVLRIHKSGTENALMTSRYLDMDRWKENKDSPLFWMTDF